MTDRRNLSRRHFLAASAGVASTLLAPGAFAADADPKPTKLDLSFWQVSDTHYLADDTDTDRIDEQSLAVNARVIDLLNNLPGQELPPAMGGGALPKPAGAIHTGDTIDSGDKNGAKFLAMQKTEWRQFTEHYGLTGSDGKLKFPVYELHGNHDAPRGTGLAIENMVERTRKRPGVTNASKNGVHYSWDWQNVHFVSLGITVGGAKRTPRVPHFDPLDSYDFLKSDLAAKVGQSGRPVVLCHHIDLARYSVPCEPAAPPPTDGKRVDWDPCDVHAFHDAVKDYNVVAIIYGHTHARSVFHWDGQSPKAPAGIDVFNCDDAGHFRGAAHGILHYHLTDTTMTVREFATKDHWKTAAWTRAWIKPITLGKA